MSLRPPAGQKPPATASVARSTHVDRFNHDEDAADYDRDVADETDPIRAGYRALLQWVAQRASAKTSIEEREDDSAGAARILEIGSGTGNLTQLLPTAHRIWCVDISEQMTAIARSKLASRRDITFLRADALEALALPEIAGNTFHAIVSTYTLHHLTEPEKRSFIALAMPRLEPGGRLVVGDLMFEGEEQAAEILSDLRRAGRGETADEIEDEFFWRLDLARAQLEQLGRELEIRRFSELSWAFACRA